MFSKSTKFWVTKFRLCENDIFLIQNEFLFSYFAFLLLVCFIEKKAKYTTRCSVKSSTIYVEQLILQLYFSFSKSTKFWATKFRRCEKFFLFVQNEFVFSYFIFLLPDMFCLKKPEYTIRCSVKSSTIHNDQFILCMRLFFLK